MIILMVPLICLAVKKVEFRLSRNYGELIYDFSGNTRHSSNGNKLTDTTYNGIFTDRGFYISSSACALPLSTNPTVAFPNPGTVLVWAKTSSTAGRFIHQYIDGTNFIYYRKGSSNTLQVAYNFNSAASGTVNGPANSFLSGKSYLGTWVMISITISGRYIKVYQNLSLMVTLDYVISYNQNYRIVIGSCSTSDLATESFVYYFVVFDSDSIQNSYFGGASNNCLTGAGSCVSCSYSVYLDYISTTGCISDSISTTADAFGNTCSAGYTCRDGLTLKCLCPSSSCYFNSSNLVQCIDQTTGILTQTAISCSNIGQGCCMSTCYECNTESSCISCVSSKAFVDSDGMCSCKDGYYGTRPITSDSSCSSCHAECLKCSSSQVCTTCVASNSSPSSVGCVCDEGFYSTGALTTTNSCLHCNSDCLSCTNSSTCTVCVSLNTRITSTGCVCIDGYWGIAPLNSLDSCIKCSIDCLTCTNSSTCTTCVSLNTIITSTGCVCANGYWGAAPLNSINSCTICNSDCLTCTNSSNCLTCKSQHSLPSVNGCICEIGYWGVEPLTSASSCQKCADECLKCSNSSMCSECISKNAQATATGCICKEGYYSSGALLSENSCIKCKDECLACSSGDSCDSCIALSSQTKDTSCTCLNGFFVDGSMANVNACQKCGDECSTCDNSSSCTTCVSLNSKPFNNGCICVDGYWSSGLLLSSDSCKLCSQECLKCTNSSTCTVCLSLNAEATDSGCVCKKGFWGSPPLISAISCISCNPECLECTNSSTCSVCISANTEITSTGCKCKTGFYSNGPLTSIDSCIKCKEECLSCASASSCNSCIALNSIPLSQSCSCLPSYFASAPMSEPNACQPCGPECMTCLNSYSCENCKSLNAFVFSSGCHCKEGFFSLGALTSTDSCIPCSSECLSCSNLSSCVSCVADNSEVTSTGCRCKSGYFGSLPLITKDSCTKCQSSCSICSDLSTCLECLDPNSRLVDGTCKCIDGYFVIGMISISNPCQKCAFGCLLCSALDLCSQCSSTNMIIEAGKCTCRQGFWIDFTNQDAELCKACDYSCKSCVQKQYCTLCKSDYAQEINGTCVCQPGFFISTKSILDPCEICHPFCKSCINSSSCSECKDPNAIPTSPYCTCVDGYWPDHTNNSLTCRNCSEVCEKCLNFTFCLQCKPPKVQISGKCIDLCPSNCSSCTENGTCTKCADPNAILISSMSSCRCKLGFFLSPSLDSCQVCMDLCERCSNFSTCEKCSVNSYYSSSECKCLEGFTKSNNDCIKIFFSMSSRVTQSNTVRLQFTEKLKNELKLADLQVRVQTRSSFSFTIFTKSSELTYLHLKFSESIKEGQPMTLIFLQPVLSLNGSELDKMIYNLTLHQFDFIDPLISSLLQSTKALAQGAAISSVSASFSNPGSLWILINTLQLVTYLPLSSAKLTHPMKEMCRNLANLNLAPNFLLLFLKNDTSFNLTNGMIDSGVDSGDFWINYGSNLTIFVVFMAIWPFIVLLSKINVRWISKRFQILRKSYKFGFFIRFWIQGYLEISIYSLIQILRYKASTDSSPKDWQFYLNYISSNIFMVCVLVTPLAQSLFLWKNSEKILSNQEEVFIDQYGSLFSEFKNTKGLKGLVFYPLFSFRRLVYVLCQILLIDNHTVQLSVNSFLSLLLLCYLLWCLPFKDRVNLLSNILSEVTVLVCFIVVLLSGTLERSDLNQIFEKIFCWMIFSFLVVNSVVVLYNMIVFIRKFWLIHEKVRALQFIKEFRKNNSIRLN